jgi:TonB-dependent starch-binding outer membrane protein SusC
MKKLILIFFLMIFPIFLFSEGEEKMKTSEAIELKGNVFDKKTNEELAGVTIEVISEDSFYEKIYTDIDGDFKINLLKDSEYQIKVNYISYKDTTFSLNEKSNLEIGLSDVTIVIK